MSEKTMKLFIIYIGGAHEKSLIELHDMRFIIAEKIEDTYDALRNSWWGTPKSLHLDAWGVLEHADGYDIEIKNEPSSDNRNKLYFVNLGGYDSNEFTELHKNVFIVAKSELAAKEKAKNQIVDWQSPHRDYQFDIDKIIEVEDFSGGNYYIHLTKTENNKPFQFICKYEPIGAYNLS
jgi:hypothetical protein